MQINSSRFQAAFKAMTVHLGLSLLVAGVVALLVFTIWFPYPYRELAGGSELFILVMAVDIVCGPLLTFVLFSPTKPKKELRTDISLIVVIQLLALCYGIWNVWLTRPIFVVHESDRLNITARVNVDSNELAALPSDLQPKIFGGPIMASLRQFSAQEQEALNEDIKKGGKDRSERPYFYTKFDGVKAYQSGFSLGNYLRVHSEKQNEVKSLIGNIDASNLERYKYLPIVGRIYWLAVYDETGKNIGFIKL